jgi:DnaK suppressor protein
VRQDNDPGDPTAEAAALAERERILNSEYDEELGQKIDHALERIQEGTYGVSEVSGRPIPVERLEAMAWATTLPDEEPIEDA